MDTPIEVPGRYDQSWFLPNARQWMDELKPLKGKLHTHALEIGSWQGQSTVFLLKYILTHPTATIDVVDCFTGGSDQNSLQEQTKDGRLLARFKENIEPYKEKVTIHQGMSQDELPKLKKDYYSYVYHDASHLAEDLYNDCRLIWPLLKKGGLFFIDDCPTWTWRYLPNDHHNPAIDDPIHGLNKFLAEIRGEYEETYRVHQIHIKKL